MRNFFLNLVFILALTPLHFVAAQDLIDEEMGEVEEFTNELDTKNEVQPEASATVKKPEVAKKPKVEFGVFPDEPSTVKPVEAAVAPPKTVQQTRPIAKPNSVTTYESTANRYPQTESQFVKPAGPKEGGKVKVPHPFAKKGLLSIDANNTYQYKAPTGNKTKAYSIRYGYIDNPRIKGPGTTSFSDMYATGSTFNILSFDTEWIPFKKYGKVVAVFGTGIAQGQGRGSFATPRPKRDPNTGLQNGTTADSQSQEIFDIYIVPLTAQLNYRLEYFDRQIIAPYVSTGMTYFGLAEYQRGDNATDTKFSGAPTVFAGGGLNFNISRWSARSAFDIYSKYKIVDLWLTLDYKRVQTLKADIDFSGNFVQLGVTMDL